MKKLEKLVNGIRGVGKRSWKFVKDNATYLAFGTALVLGGQSAKADGGLRIVNRVGDTEPSFCFVQQYDGATDGYDGAPKDMNIDFNDPDVDWSGMSGAYSVIPGHNLQYETVANNSKKPFNVKLFYHGNIVGHMSNRLVFFDDIEDPCDPNAFFGKKPVILESDRLPSGTSVDIKKLIEYEMIKNGGYEPNVPLINLVAGTYLDISPYGNATVKIGTTFLGDLSCDGKVDFHDMKLFLNDWLKSGPGLRGDISGPNGKPNGIVTFIDYPAIAENYRKDINDSNTW